MDNGVGAPTRSPMPTSITRGPDAPTSLTAPPSPPSPPSPHDFGTELPIAVIITDAAGTVTFWSPAATELYGFAIDDAVGTPIYELTVGPTEARIAEEIMAAVVNGLPWEGEFTARRADGSEVNVRVLDLPVLDAAGAVAGIVGLSYDTDLAADDLDLAIDSLGRLSGVAHEVRRIERRRLARDLHDGLGQMLAAIRTEVHGVCEALDDLDAGRTTATQMRADTERLAALVDTMAADLRAMYDSLADRSVCDPLGLATALHRRGLEVQQRTGMKVVIDIDPQLTGGPDGIAMGGDVSDAIQHIVVEALNNCERHSRAQRVEVHLAVVGGLVHGVVVDDGVGARASSTGRPGFGTSTMTERARELGGELSIRSGDIGGTHVAFTVPVWRRT